MAVLELLVSWLCVLSLALAASSPRPHIVFIVADDLGHNDVSFHGSNQIPTPNIDRLAYDGVILDNYYVSPICTPTRGAIMSGRHPIHTGLQHSVIAGTQTYGLPLDEKIMPQYLNELGYRSHIVGKWHLGFFAEEYCPTFRGFESHFGYWLGEEDYFDHISFPFLNMSGLDFRNNMDLVWNMTGHYSTDLFTDRAVDIITKHNKSEPLFLYLPYQAVHSGNTFTDPLQAPQHYVDRFPNIHNPKRKLFAGMVAALDDGVGRVYQTLHQQGMLNNSIIVFTTDNGGPSNGFDANAANNFPLRGVKATLWEGGVRGVGFVHSPLLKQAPFVSRQLLHVTDWLPTLYRAAGGDARRLRANKLDGVDAWHMLMTNGAPVRTELLHNIDPLGKFGGLRVGDYKLVYGDVGMDWGGWYPPWQSPEDSVLLHVDSYRLLANSSDPDLRRLLQKKEREAAAAALAQAHTAGAQQQGKPVRVQCGPKPANASSNCDPVKSACLFHIPSDPCEYNNVAASHPDVVIQLLERLQQYEYGMVPPLNTRFDPRGNPKFHHDAWVPWVTLPHH